jgi:hypothetical protein
MGNDMPQKNQNRRFARAALYATFGVFMVVAGGIGATYAADDEEGSILPDEKFFRSFMRGLGLRNGQEAGIEYKERPPLVVPPSRNLPAPVANGSLSANNPAWPTDPDETKRKADRKARAERKPYDWLESGNVLSPKELAIGKTDKPATGEPVRTVDEPEMSPAQLGYTTTLWNSFKGIGSTFSKEKEPETARFSREPPRATLTDPPAGYRTPSPEQPYGLNAKAARAKAQSLEERQTEGMGR